MDKTVMVRMTQECKDELKLIAKQRGMTMVGILTYCVKLLKKQKDD